MIFFSVMQKCCKNTGDCTASVGAVWVPFTGRNETGKIAKGETGKVAKGETSISSLSSNNQRRWLPFLYGAEIS